MASDLLGDTPLLWAEGNHTDNGPRSGGELAEVDCPFKGEERMVFSVESSSKCLVVFLFTTSGQLMIILCRLYFFFTVLYTYYCIC